MNAQHVATFMNAHPNLRTHRAVQDAGLLAPLAQHCAPVAGGASHTIQLGTGRDASTRLLARDVRPHDL
jgi:hypothetical protein